MTSTDVPLSASERWDKIAAEVKRGRGQWVVIGEGAGRTNRVREHLERRNLNVEIRSRVGDGSAERPWHGTRTWARTI